MGPLICVFSRQCGRAIAVEHNGDVYACDHYVYPEYLLGNLRNDDFARMVRSSVNSGFGPHKENSLPGCCLECSVLHACWGGCPKHRFMQSPQAGTRAALPLCRIQEVFPALVQVHDCLPQTDRARSRAGLYHAGHRPSASDPSKRENRIQAGSIVDKIKI